MGSLDSIVSSVIMCRGVIAVMSVSDADGSIGMAWSEFVVVIGLTLLLCLWSSL